MFVVDEASKAENRHPLPTTGKTGPHYQTRRAAGYRFEPCQFLPNPTQHANLIPVPARGRPGSEMVPPKSEVRRAGNPKKFPKYGRFHLALTRHTEYICTLLYD